MHKGRYHPTGELQGDDKALPDRGTSVGHTGKTEAAGIDHDQSCEATNRIGSIKGTSKSDPCDACD
jgi:hypothetical protein